jgi:hypothetical protein
MPHIDALTVENLGNNNIKKPEPLLVLALITN